MKRPASLAVMIAVAGVAACKPPPTDAQLNRAMPAAAATFASDPLPSPDTAGAIWTLGAEGENPLTGRIIYGIAGQPALMALECVDEAGELPALRITRLSPADEGAGALLALVGNGSIGRLAIDAAQIGGRNVWQGTVAASDEDWEPLAGPRQVTATVPGAGMIVLNPSPLPMQLLDRCRNS